MPISKKKKRRPKDILKLGAIEDDQVKNATQHNSNCCPLLSVLSPEIRNRIYSHAFGDVHVSPKQSATDPGRHYTTKPQLRVCIGAADDYEDGKCLERHTHCAPKMNDERLPLALLQTCRQIHDEAALLPFASVNYMVNAEVLTAFMRGMIRVQKTAISRLTLVLNHSSYYWRIAEEDARALIGVEQLRIVVTGNGISDLTLEKLKELARLPLKQVDIMLSFSRDDIGDKRWTGVQTAAERLKAELLRPWEQIQLEQREAKEAEHAAAAAKRDQKQGTLAGRRRAGQLSRDGTRHLDVHLEGGVAQIVL